MKIRERLLFAGFVILATLVIIISLALGLAVALGFILLFRTIATTTIIQVTLTLIAIMIFFIVGTFTVDKGLDIVFWIYKKYLSD